MYIVYTMIILIYMLKIDANQFYHMVKVITYLNSIFTLAIPYKLIKVNFEFL